MPSNAPSRRFSSRVPTLPIPIGDVWVYWECGNRRDISRVRDISMHGLFIETPKPMIKGASTSLHFLVQDGQIRADAVVRHASAGIGQGLKFTAVNVEDARHLASLVTRLRGLNRERSVS
jgi:hypothetical protein